MKDDTRTRVLAELQRIHHEIANCAHCAALRHSYANLSILLPPDPIEANGKLYVFNPPPEYVALVERMARQYLGDPYRDTMGSGDPND